MRYSEFKKAVEKLSIHYQVYETYAVYKGVVVNYNLSDIFTIDSCRQYHIETHYGNKLENLPYSHKLWMLAAEFAMTPIDQREDKKYQFQFDNGRYLDTCDVQNIHGKPYIRFSTTDKDFCLTSTDKSTFDIANRFLDGHVVERDADDD